MMKVVAAFAIYIAVVFSHPPGPKKPEISVSRVGPVMEDKRGLDGRRSLLKSKLDLFRRLEECAQPDIYGCVQWEQQGLCTNATYQAFMETKCGAACGLCTAPAPPPPSAETVDVSSCLGRHNTKRGLHQGLIPSYSMTWDSTLASAAETWALQLINDDVDNNVAMTTLNLVHSSPNGQYGENLYGSVSSSGAGSCEDATDLWYAEIADYDWNYYNQSTGVIGHFTQVVWKNSLQLGVGAAKYTAGGLTKTYIVARYAPAGNVVGQANYDANVPPLI